MELSSIRIQFVSIAATLIVLILMYTKRTDSLTESRSLNFLDQNDFSNSNWSFLNGGLGQKNQLNKNNDGENKLINSSDKSKLRLYRTRNVVQCLDAVSNIRNRSIHLAFIGDSTVRQYFLNFLQLIPDYDQKVARQSTAKAVYNFHEDRNVTSQLLNNLLVSFRWRAVMDDEFIADFKRWTRDDAIQVPDFILLGITVHHMQQNFSRKFPSKQFKDILEKDFLPTIQQFLIAHPNQEIIWLNQGPTMDLLGPITAHQNIEIYVRKIVHYNKIIRNILKDINVLMWDSFHPALQEYIRSCALTGYNRHDNQRYFNCQDFIHPGFGMLSLATQLFVNHICSCDYKGPINSN